jgi:hypothetical protein
VVVSLMFEPKYSIEPTNALNPTTNPALPSLP